MVEIANEDKLNGMAAFSTDGGRRYKAGQRYGSTGLEYYNGYNFEEFLSQLQGDKGRRTYKEMRENEPIIAAILQMIELIIVGAKYSVVAAEHDIDESYKRLVEYNLFKAINFSDFLTNALSMLVYGWAYFELIYSIARDEQIGTYYGLKYIAPRHQLSLQNWDMDDATGEVFGMVQQPPQGITVTIPISKAIHFRTADANGDPEGRSCLRACYIPYYYKKKLQEIQAIGIERNLAGTPVVRIPSEVIQAGGSIYEGYKSVARDLRLNEQGGIVIGSDKYTDVDGNPTAHNLIDIDLLAASGRNDATIEDTIARYTKEIANVILFADFITLGGTSTGSYALGETKAEAFYLACERFAKRVVSTLNAQLLPRFWAQNGFPIEYMPAIEVDDVKPIDREALANYINKLAMSGVMVAADDKAEAYLRDLAGLPNE